MVFFSYMIGCIRSECEKGMASYEDWACCTYGIKENTNLCGFLLKVLLFWLVILFAFIVHLWKWPSSHTWSVASVVNVRREWNHMRLERVVLMELIKELKKTQICVDFYSKFYCSDWLYYLLSLNRSNLYVCRARAHMLCSDSFVVFFFLLGGWDTLHRRRE
jgi:hypothetical protein